jgi:predicted HicB family RNase H-like nuclease
MLKYKDYIAKVDFDDELDCFVGEIINIKDVITFKGSTAKELKTEFKNSVNCYLDFCKKKNKDPDKPFSGKLLVRLSPDVHREIYSAARSNGLSVNKWISIALKHAVANFDNHPGH